VRKSILISALVGIFIFLYFINYAFIGPGLIFIILLRLVVALTIFKFPLWGTVASLLVDCFDVVLADVFGSIGIISKVPDGLYDKGDKILDTFYLAIAFFVSFGWKEKLAKWTSISLFVYRVIGVILFEITNIRILMFIFPNLFENWFLFWAARNKYFSKFKLTVKKLVIILVILLIPKMIQEYFLHYAIIHPWTKIKAFLGLFN